MDSGLKEPADVKCLERSLAEQVSFHGYLQLSVPLLLRVVFPVYSARGSSSSGHHIVLDSVKNCSLLSRFQGPGHN